MVGGFYGVRWGDCADLHWLATRVGHVLGGWSVVVVVHGVGAMGRAVLSLPDDCSVSFERVYEAERDGIRRLAYLLVRSEPVAEELAQEAFLRLYTRFATVENPAGFLRTVVVRLGLTWRSRRDMEQQRLVSVRPALWNEMDELDETWEAIGRLRPERAAVLVLRFYET